LTGVLRDVLAAPAGAWPADVQPSDPQPRRATGETIRAARTTLGWTQADLATRMRKSRSAVAQWELGHAHPTAASLNELAALLGLQASDLLPPIT
jgi:ribosome-binding protein aMBF1 (putative translation factor)